MITLNGSHMANAFVCIKVTQLHSRDLDTNKQIMEKEVTAMATVIRKKIENGSIIILQPVAEVEGITLYAEASDHGIQRIPNKRPTRVSKSCIDKARKVEAFVPQ